MHRKNKDNPHVKRQVPSLGSVYGGCLTFVVYIILIFYIVTNVSKMINRQGDTIFKHTKTNHFLEPDNQALMKDYIFMPSIEIKLNNKSDKNVEKLKKMGLINAISSNH